MSCRPDLEELSDQLLLEQALTLRCEIDNALQKKADVSEDSLQQLDQFESERQRRRNQAIIERSPMGTVREGLLVPNIFATSLSLPAFLLLNGDGEKKPANGKDAKTEKSEAEFEKEIDFISELLDLALDLIGLDMSKEEIKRLIREQLRDPLQAERLRELLREVRENRSTQRRERRADAVEQPGMRERRQPAALREGQQLHRQLEVRPGEVWEHQTPGMRGQNLGPVDRYDSVQRRLREIKPVSGIDDGIRQLREKKAQLDAETPNQRPHEMELTVYFDADERGHRMVEHYRVNEDGSRELIRRETDRLDRGIGATQEARERREREQRERRQREERQRREREERERREREERRRRRRRL